ncbi:peptidoglycan binding domain-containing protein, partial [Streptomyces sp. URMC 125]|uniref:peptidoglycan binding domain-containing protein n=1 Tax=Streptomyces sp. URMC 125 TaxID=3423419 RepID=UPI003F1BA29C
APAAGGLRGPDGPTTGPAAGDSLLPPGFQQQPDAPGPSGHPDTGQHPVPGVGTAPEPPQAGGPLLDLGGPAPAHREHVSGDTLVSGIPRVPADAGRPSAPSDPFDDHDGREEQADHGDRDEPEPRPAPARRGRSKLVLLGVAAVGALGIAYGAGLLLDHADVPNGTTVLGVGIGGTSKEEAVDKLESVLGERAEQPLVLDVEGKRTTLKPSVAGLAFDTETTVDEAAGRDYNPVSVIGSLFGGTRVAEPALTVDEEKLAAALKGLTAQGSGGVQEGMVTFTDGKAVGVPGKPYKQVDVAKSTDLLEDAYRKQIATGSEAAVTLPVSLKQPRIGQEEIDRAIREFGRPAMSGLVTVRAGDRSIPFSPERSLPKFLSMKPVGDKLVDTYDLKVLEQLYGSTFDGVLVARGNGTKTPVTPQDVAGALREALRQTDPAKRVGVIELDPQ